MSPNYSPVTEDVLSVIGYLGQQNSALEVTKTYRGIVVQQDVNILEINSEEVTLRVTDIETCTALKGEVYLHNPLFPKPVMAQLKSMDLNKGLFVLSGLAYKDSDWKKRQYERVQPKHPTYVNLHWKGITVRACLANISVDGMGVTAYKLVEKGIKIQPGANIKLDFQLLADHKYTSTKGTVIYINATGKSLSLLGIRLYPRPREVHRLEKYITQRKQEILHELSLAYWEKSKPGGVESLYF